MDPLENVLYLQSNRNIVIKCFIWSLLTEVLPLSGCLTFLKASDSPSLQT